MSRILVVLSALMLCSMAQAQSQSGPALREIVETARTNLPAALALCDKAISNEPTNAQPLLLRARLFERGRRYEDGIRDLTVALKLEPKVPEIWQERGEQNFKASHFKESVADFDHVLELAPAQAPQHWQRGISLYYAGRFGDGRKQFELHQTVNPNDVENAAWHFLCAARESSVTNARAVMLKAGRDGRIPMQEIDALYRGSGSVERVLEAATRGASETRGRDAMFYAHLYLGLYFDVMGDAAKARAHIGKAAGEFSSEHYMGDVARVHLHRFNARP
jgi:lipoprotein NlpI